MCIVLLCSIHIFRYWKDKILPSARSYEDDKQVTLDGEVKASIYGQIKDLSSSPTEDIFCQRLQNLYQTSANVYIKASQYATEFEPFEDVFERNWNNCRGMWVKCYTKGYPLLGIDNTQRAEAMFRALKWYISFTGHSSLLWL